MAGSVGMRTGRRRLIAVVAGALVLLFPGAVAGSVAGSLGHTAAAVHGRQGQSATGAAVAAPAAATLPTGFTDTTVFSGLTNPTEFGSRPTDGSSSPRRAG